MSDQGGGRRPPSDDRTLLDPLNPEELKALRDAREKILAQKSGSAVAHQVVIGPEPDEDIGNAPTRAMPALPRFENPGISLDKIPTGDVPSPDATIPAIPSPIVPSVVRVPSNPPPHTGRPEVPLASSRPGPGEPARPIFSPKPQEPMSILGTTQPESRRSSATGSGETVAPSGRSIARDKREQTPRPATREATAPTPAGALQATIPVRPGANQGAAPPPGGAPRPGAQPGFGENTLLWMAPPKIAPGPTTGTATGGDLRRTAASSKALVKAAGVFLVLAAVVGFLVWGVLGKKERGVIDLHTNPPRASVRINGTQTKNLTPMKLNLVEGTWEIEVSLEGYRPQAFTVNVEGGAQPIRRDVELEPISKAGLMTISIAVQPVASNITVDGQVYPAKRQLSVANLDPASPHKIAIEAGGYVKIEQDIAAGQLKKSYSFYLQQDEDSKPK